MLVYILLFLLSLAFIREEKERVGEESDMVIFVLMCIVIFGVIFGLGGGIWFMCSRDITSLIGKTDCIISGKLKIVNSPFWELENESERFIIIDYEKGVVYAKYDDVFLRIPLLLVFRANNFQTGDKVVLRKQTLSKWWMWLILPYESWRIDKVY